MVSRRNFIKESGMAFSAVYIASQLRASAASTATAKPNILLVMTDQWNPYFFSFGPLNNGTSTPNLAAFAPGALRFDRYYSTTPRCSPNRAAIITGQYPHESGMLVNDLMIPPDIPCLPDVLADGGYKTYYTGKWHMDGGAKPGWVPKGFRRRGFDIFEGFNRGHSYNSDTTLFESDSSTFISRPYPADDPTATWEPTRETNLAMDFIRDHKDEPWFAYVSWGPPHGSNSLIPGLDTEFGRLMGFLDAEGLKDNTIVVFTSDHGDMNREHYGVRNKSTTLLGAKRVPYEESFRIPLLCRWPSRFATGATDHLVSSVDIMPTLISLAGLEVPETCTGVDRSPLLFGESMPETPVFGEDVDGSDFGAAWRAVAKRINGVMYKLIAIPSLDGTIIEYIMLFDVDADPYEMTNLIDFPAHAATQFELVQTLTDWMNASNDQFPSANPRAAKTYSATATLNQAVDITPKKLDGGMMSLQVASQSRIYFRLEKSTDMKTWEFDGDYRHGNGSTINFNIDPWADPETEGFYRVKAFEGYTPETLPF